MFTETKVFLFAWLCFEGIRKEEKKEVSHVQETTEGRIALSIEFMAASTVTSRSAPLTTLAYAETGCGLSCAMAGASAEDVGV